jgi:spore coat protein U-like protein
LLAHGSTLTAATIGVSATVLSKSKCKFNEKGATLAFGDLDPISHPDITRTAYLTFECNGPATIATYAITDNDGENPNGPNANRMAHENIVGAYLPYSFSLSPTSGSVEKTKGGTSPSLTVSGTLLGDDYSTAQAGPYSDTVIITINP